MFQVRTEASIEPSVTLPVVLGEIARSFFDHDVAKESPIP